MAFDNIERPDDFLGVTSVTGSNDAERNPFDAAHAFESRPLPENSMRAGAQ